MDDATGSVRCVVSVQDVTEHVNYYRRQSRFKGNCKTVRMTPISPGDHVPEGLKAEAKEMWEASPSGEIKLGILNPPAAAFFSVDGIYEVTFRKIGEIERPE